MICVCKISKIDTNKGIASISIPDHDGIVIDDIPFVTMEPWERMPTWQYPKSGDTVIAVFEGTDGRYGRGYILGRPSK